MFTVSSFTKIHHMNTLRNQAIQFRKSCFGINVAVPFHRRLLCSTASDGTINTILGVTDKSKVSNNKSKKNPAPSKANKSVANSNSTEVLEDIRNIRINKINIIKEKGGNPFAYSFQQTHKTADLVLQVQFCSRY